MNKMTPHKLHQFLNYEQTPESSLGKMILRNKVSMARALSIPCRYDIVGHIKSKMGKLPQVDINNHNEVRDVIVQYINDQMKSMKSETDQLDEDEIKMLDQELFRFYAGIKDKTNLQLRDQAIDFIDYWTSKAENSTYDTRDLRRALQSPQLSDIAWLLKAWEHMMAPDRRKTYLWDPLIRWDDVEQVKKILHTELVRQSNGETVDIESIWQEYKKFLAAYSKEIRQDISNWNTVAQWFGPRPH